ANSALIELLPEQRVKLCEIIKKYPLNNIFNTDETGLYFCIAPHQMLASQLQSSCKK
ncbi:35152_t:CDS:1, partial [Racocetra persica]